MFNLFSQKPSVAINFNEGPYLEITSTSTPLTTVFIDADTNKVVHQSEISGHQWTRAHQCFYTNWKVELLNQRGKIVYSHRFDLTGRSIRINIDSKSLGDTLAWLPQIQRFAEIHSTSTIHVSHFWKSLFDNEAYSKLRFIKPQDPLHDCYATYNIGFHLDNIDTHHPEDPRLQPLGKVAADILGIKHKEIRPKLSRLESTTSLSGNKDQYVCIADASTAGCKLWQHENGWQTIVDYLRECGYQAVSIQKEPTCLERVIDLSGDHDILERIAQIRGSEFFIGLGSGLSWLAWAAAKPVVLISGFSKPLTEFQMGCHRVFNPDVCNGCWNDIRYIFDRNDWDWCPRHKGTDRQFECSKAISPKMVIQQIDQIISNTANPTLSQAQ